MVLPIWQTWWSCQLFCPSLLAHIVNLRLTCWRFRAGSIVGFFLLGFANFILCALDYATYVRCASGDNTSNSWETLIYFWFCKETQIDNKLKIFSQLFNNVCTFTREAYYNEWRNWLMDPSQDIFDLVEDLFGKEGLGFVLIKPPISCHMYKRWMVVSVVEAFM